jgi:hypothetical protein
MGASLETSKTETASAKTTLYNKDDELDELKSRLSTMEKELGKTLDVHKETANELETHRQKESVPSFPTQKNENDNPKSNIDAKTAAEKAATQQTAEKASAEKAAADAKVLILADFSQYLCVYSKSTVFPGNGNHRNHLLKKIPSR